MPTSETITRIVSANVRAMLARQNVSRGQLADHLQMAHSQISRRLAGQIEWRLSDLVEAARFLDVPLSELIPDSIVEAHP